MTLLRRLLPASFSGQLALVAGGGLLVFALVLGGVGLLALHGQWQRSLEQRADSLARELAAVTLDAMLMRDYGTIDRYLADIVDGEEVVGARVVKDNGRTLSRKGSLGGPDHFTATSPITLMGQTEGRVTVAIGGPTLRESLRGPVLLIGTILLTATVTLFLVLRRFLLCRLIEPLRTLAAGVSPLQPAPEDPERPDAPREVREVAHSFQTMRAQIDAHIRELEEANRQVRSATERACSEHRLAALGQLSAGLAHGLNTPIANVVGYAQMGQRAADPQSEAFEALTTIERQGRSCAHIVSNLLDMAGRADPRPEPAYLDRLLPEFARMLRPSLEAQGLTDVTTDVEADLVAWADPGVLEHVVFNLATNAVQAGATRLWLEAGSESGKARMAIADDGPGIPAEFQDPGRLFDPFVTTKERGHGTGLGLYMCRTLMDAMGGNIELAATATTGTRFRLELGLCCPTPPPTAAESGESRVSLAGR